MGTTVRCHSAFRLDVSTDYDTGHGDARGVLPTRARGCHITAENAYSVHSA